MALSGHCHEVALLCQASQLLGVSAVEFAADHGLYHVVGERVGKASGYRLVHKLCAVACLGYLAQGAAGAERIHGEVGAHSGRHEEMLVVGGVHQLTVGVEHQESQSALAVEGIDGVRLHIGIVAGLHGGSSTNRMARFLTGYWAIAAFVLLMSTSLLVT